VRQSSNKKVVAEFEKKINILSIPTEEIAKEISIKEEISSIETSSSQIVVTNLLKNESFEEWRENDQGPTFWTGSHSFKTNWVKDSENVLIGNYSVKVKGGGERTLKQNVNLLPNKTYYAEVWVKGTGQIRIAIIYPSGYYNYNATTTLENSDWVKITHQAKTTEKEGSEGGIAIKTIDPGGDTPQNTLYIDAVWLGETPPPQNWPK
jgi:hypothetical protein